MRGSSPNVWRRIEILSLSAAAVATACSGSSGQGSTYGVQRDTDAIVAEFDALVEQSNQCTADDECVYVASDCPLPCYVAVHRDHESAVEQRAAELVTEYEMGGEACGSGCSAPPAAACSAGRCVQP